MVEAQKLRGKSIRLTVANSALAVTGLSKDPFGKVSYLKQVIRTFALNEGNGFYTS